MCVLVCLDRFLSDFSAQQNGENDANDLDKGDTDTNADELFHVIVQELFTFFDTTLQ